MNSILIFVVTLAAVLHGALSLRCYSCKPEYASNCHYSYQQSVVQCGPRQDTCWKFTGNTTSNGIIYIGQETRMCAVKADLIRWSPGTLYANSCNTVYNIRSTDGQFFRGQICLCDRQDLCNYA
ncbi:hypothetical protein BV898_12377 [Hypsibius exemplaris]|uniref:Protein sleepless n=1 Tax=Hypsibius exemplaris TaxID=2072580 RepID=A0A1W0WE69_HYPEX|nr:hypothetical protein BV898_12377 [Hypsibius exemplaris]